MPIGQSFERDARIPLDFGLAVHDPIYSRAVESFTHTHTLAVGSIELRLALAGCGTKRCCNTVTIVASSSLQRHAAQAPLARSTSVGHEGGEEGPCPWGRWTQPFLFSQALQLLRLALALPVAA